MSTAFALVAAFVVVPFSPLQAAPATKTVTVSGITCATSATITVSTAVAKDDDLKLEFSGSGCNGFVVNKFNNFTSMSGDGAGNTVSGSNTITLGQRKQYSALSTPKTTLATITNGTITVTIENVVEATTSSFTSNTPPDGTVSTAYSYTFVATGSPNYYELASGSLPAGLTLNADTGVLSGTPTTAGSYTFAIKVTNLVSDAVVTASGNTVQIAAGGATSQTITYNGASNTELSSGSVSVTASASSNLAVTLTSTTTSVCTVSGTSPNFTISLVSAGTCSTTATQAGDSTYSAATAVTRSFTVSNTGGGGSSGGGEAAPASATPTPTAERKITLCHRTSSFTNPYVEITVDKNSVLTEGHGSHTGGLYPNPGWGDVIPAFDGFAGLNWPAGSEILANGCKTPKDKVTLCHATSSKTNPYVLITVDKNSILRRGHGSHTGGLFPQPKWGDIIPPFDGFPGLNWPGGEQILDWGCETSAPDPLVVKPTKEPIPVQPRCLANPVPAGTPPLTRDKVKLAPGPKANEVEIVSTDNEPLTLLSMQVNDSTATLDVVSSGSDLNKPSVWESLGYGDRCWKLEPFGDTDYQFTLPNPLSPPAGFPAGMDYSTVIVKAGSLKETDPNYQVNTIFGAPKPGDVVWADVNKNGIFDPGGQGKDKAISHIIICGRQTASPTPTLSRLGSTSPTPTPTPSQRADICEASPSPTPEPSSSNSPSPTSTRSSSTPSAATSSTGATPSSSTSTSSTSPSPTSSTSSPRPSSTSGSATPSTPGTSPAPSGSSATPSPSASSSSRTPSIAPSETPSPEPKILILVDPTPSPSPTSSGSSGTSGTPNPSSSGSATPSSSSSPGGGSTPSSDGSSGPTSGPSGAVSSQSPTLTTRIGTVTFTVAQGDQTLTFTVPMSRMRALAARAGTADLADTGTRLNAPLAAAILLIATGLMLVPVVRRHRG